MRAVVRVTALVTAAVAAWWTAGACSSAVAAGTTDVCSLLTRAEVERITGRRQYRDPDAAELAGGSVCGYNDAEVMLFSGEGSGERLEAMLKSFGHDKDERHPVSGVGDGDGDGAYVIYPEPRNEYQDRGAFLVAKAGQHTVAVSLRAEEGKPAESAQPKAVALARAVIARLR